jgi:hypothetical protein
MEGRREVNSGAGVAQSGVTSILDGEVAGSSPVPLETVGGSMAERLRCLGRFVLVSTSLTHNAEALRRLGVTSLETESHPRAASVLAPATYGQRADVAQGRGYFQQWIVGSSPIPVAFCKGCQSRVAIGKPTPRPASFSSAPTTSSGCCCASLAVLLAQLVRASDP